MPDEDSGLGIEGEEREAVGCTELAARRYDHHG